MACNTPKQSSNCGCNFNIKSIGMCDASKIVLDGSKPETLSWSEISVPEVLCIPAKKPDIEDIDQVYVTTEINNIKLIETPFAHKIYPIVADAGLVTTLQGIVDGLATSLNTGGDIADGIDAIEALVNTATGAISALGGLVTPELATAINDLLNGLLDPVTEALANLLDANTALDNNLGLVPVLLGTVEELVNNLLSALNDLLNALTSLLGVTLDGVVDLVVSLLKSLGLSDTVIDGVMILVKPVLQTLTNALGNAVTPVITLVQNVVTSLLTVDIPDKTMAFEIIKNVEGTQLTGRKLVIDGVLKQKIVYTALVDVQSVHSAHFDVPFSAFIIPYPKFEGLDYEENIPVYIAPTAAATPINGYAFDPKVGIVSNLYEEFNVDVCIEDIFVYALDSRTIFKNVTLFLLGKVFTSCV